MDLSFKNLTKKLTQTELILLEEVDMFFPFTNDKQYPEDEWLTIWNLETILLGIVREFSGDLGKMNKQEMIEMITKVVGMYDNTVWYDINLEQYVEQQYASIIKFLKVDYRESNPSDSTVIMPNETFHPKYGS